MGEINRGQLARVEF